MQRSRDRLGYQRAPSVIASLKDRHRALATAG